MSGYDYMVEKAQWKKGGVAQFGLGVLKIRVASKASGTPGSGCRC